jgi:hypothetical protein
MKQEFDIERAKQELLELSKTNQNEYKKRINSTKHINLAQIKHSDTYIKLFYDVIRCLDKIDHLLNHDSLKQEMKKYAKLFLQPLEKFNNAMFQVSEISERKVLDLIKEREEIENVIDSIHESYYPTLLESLKKFAETKNSDEICKKYNDAQYLLFKDYILPENVKKIILKLVPEANNITILHLYELLKREDVEKRTKKTETVETIEKLFEMAYLKW